MKRYYVLFIVGFIESFHNRLHDEYLNLEVLLKVAKVEGVIQQWPHTYNIEHPHSPLDFKSPQHCVGFLSDPKTINTLKLLQLNGYESDLLA